MESGFKYDFGKFLSAINSIEEAIIKLKATNAIASEADGITEAYDGRDLVDSAITILNKLFNDVIMLYNDMFATLNLMRKIGGNDNLPFQTLSNILGMGGGATFKTLATLTEDGTPIDIPIGHDIMQYYTGNGIVQNYLTICNIVGGSKQGQDQCLATVRNYAQIVCEHLGIESDDEKVRNGEVGYVFDTSEDALDYIKSEIEAGYPVTLEVSNGSKKHFVMAYALKLDGNQIPEKIDETDVLYLDPVAGEVKALGTSWDEYELMARQLMHDDNVDRVNSAPLGIHGYWVGTFSGNEPQHYKNKTGAGYQGNPSNDKNDTGNGNHGQRLDKEKWANPYAPFDYYVSITLSNGTIINNRKFSTEEVASQIEQGDNNYTLPENQLPNNLPWINPSATSTDWSSYLYNKNYRAV